MDEGGKPMIPDSSELTPPAELDPDHTIYPCHMTLKQR